MAPTLLPPTPFAAHLSTRTLQPHAATSSLHRRRCSSLFHLHSSSDASTPSAASTALQCPYFQSYVPSSLACGRSSRCSLLIRTTDWYKHTRGASMDHSVLCSASKKRGFGQYVTKKEKNPKESNQSTSEARNFVSQEPNTRNQQAPQLASGSSRNLNNASFDQIFLEKVEVVRRSAMEQKKAEEDKISQAIDYDGPVVSEENTIGFATKVGVGVAVTVFGLVFAFGDFLPYGSVSLNEDAATVQKKLAEEEKSILKTKLEEYKETLSNSPEDLSALKGAIVTMKDLGEYQQASSLLEKMTKERPNNADAFRLLGDIKFELKDYDGSVSAYHNSLSASGIVDFEVLRGLTNSFLAAGKSDQAVQTLLSYQDILSESDLVGFGTDVDNKVKMNKQRFNVDPIEVDLLLGKSYSDWGHVSDAVAVYDQLISKHPDDFRGYLAKGIILKQTGNIGDAERMFIQARFFAPANVKPIVDRYLAK
ncbi:uncharacterized protein LOC122034287 [Zingiber officinale]|uniref:uncharacterized protein LOC122034287 n=1 Tax=Zingiber officinale TaxID=94328 RepID=UPI001C4BFE26|nr:uncharacterized protein LOC122034287 [Zingiber officinale]